MMRDEECAWTVIVQVDKDGDSIHVESDPPGMPYFDQANALLKAILKVGFDMGRLSLSIGANFEEVH